MLGQVSLLPSAVPKAFMVCILYPAGLCVCRCYYAKFGVMPLIFASLRTTAPPPPPEWWRTKTTDDAKLSHASSHSFDSQHADSRHKAQAMQAMCFEADELCKQLAAQIVT